MIRGRAEELEDPADPQFSYALMPYEPRVPVAGKLRSVNLLHRGFDELGIPPEADALCAASTAQFGRNGTAWGIKQQGDEISWELYYYFHRDRRPLTWARLGAVLDASPYESAPRPAGSRSWYSLSFDLTAEALRGLAPVAGYHAYATHFPADPRTAISYRVEPGELALENVYYLFDPVGDRATIEGYLASSAFPAEELGPPEQLLWPELAGGDHIAIAHKPRCEGIYFGGLDVTSLLAFLRRVRFASWMVEYVEREQDRLDHLRFDVGFDWVWQQGRPQIVKSGFYGVF